MMACGPVGLRLVRLCILDASTLDFLRGLGLRLRRGRHEGDQRVSAGLLHRALRRAIEGKAVG